MLSGLDGTIDVIVPRGGKSLVARVQQEARVPVFAHLEGNCHVYIHAAADLAMAEKIVVNAKMRRVSVCGAAETMLVDRTRLGFGLRCIKQNEDAADMVGIDVTSYKTAAFALSAMFCGTIGAIYASWVAYIDPSDAFSTLLSVKVPVMTLLGGPGTVLGPVVGAWIFVILEEMIWAQFLELNRAILGIVIVLLIFALPGGLLGVRLPAWNWRALVGLLIVPFGPYWAWRERMRIRVVLWSVGAAAYVVALGLSFR